MQPQRSINAAAAEDQLSEALKRSIDASVASRPNAADAATACGNEPAKSSPVQPRAAHHAATKHQARRIIPSRRPALHAGTITR
jgi:predicted ATPase with chaperone activity